MNEQQQYKNTKIPRYDREKEFVKNYFIHNNWSYEPTTFNLGDTKYTPDFYDAEKDIFIEVAGTRQAYHKNKDKYRRFRQIFPQLKFEIRTSSGEILKEPQELNTENDLSPFDIPFWKKIEDRTFMTSKEFKKIQKGLGLKNKELAQALKTPPRSIDNWRGGKSRIPGAVIVALHLLLEKYNG